MDINELKRKILKELPHINLVDLKLPVATNYSKKNPCLKDVLDKNVDDKYFLPVELNKNVYSDKQALDKIKNAKANNEIIKVYNKSITGKISQGSSVYHYLGVMPTINAGTHGYSMGQIIDPYSKNKNKTVRKITPNECEKLMGWIPNWTKYGINSQNKKYELSDTARYKAIGNGIVSIIPKTILESVIKDKRIIKVFSTFSGVDGSCMLLDKKKFKVVAFSEFDPYVKTEQHASNILKYQYPEIPNFGDIRKLETENCPDHDLMFISAPCQAFSIAGKRASLNDARGTLFYETARLLEFKKPKYAIFENVKGLVTGKEVDTFIHMLEIYSQAGYEMDFNLYNAKDFGVPQNRERLFMFMRRIDLK